MTSDVSSGMLNPTVSKTNSVEARVHSSCLVYYSVVCLVYYSVVSVVTAFICSTGLTSMDISASCSTSLVTVFTSSWYVLML